jgi:hypothetical protein
VFPVHTFTATFVPDAALSLAAYTAPKPPWPSLCSRVYRPFNGLPAGGKGTWSAIRPRRQSCDRLGEAILASHWNKTHHSLPGSVH